MKSTIIKTRVLIFFIVIIVMATGILTYANSAAPYQRPSDNALLFDDNTGMSLVEEWITFRISDTRSRNAEVEVIYHLKNETREVSIIDLLFIAPYLEEEEISIFFDGVQITDFVMKKADKLPENWEVSLEKASIDPIGLRTLEHDFSYWDFYSGWSKEGFQFTIDIPKGETKELKMLYKSSSGYYSYDDVVNDVYTQLYYLTPASFWNGNARVNMAIEFPSDKFELYTNMPLEKMSPTLYQGSLEQIPDEEWFFNYVDKTGLIFFTNNRSLHNGIALSVLVVVLITGLLIRKKHRLRGTLFLLLLLPVMLLFRFTYGTMFLLMYLGPIIVAIAIFFSFIIYMIKRNRKNKPLG
ncbi:MAG: hypothetical protein KMY55_00350 [Dethiosulfatibacter sp.]|nr:hypothetical protein [Dethiosulfatibacter sp.]